MKFLSLVRQAKQEENETQFTRAFNSYSKAVQLTNNNNTKAKLVSRQGWCLHFIGNHFEANDLFSSLYKTYPTPEGFSSSAIYFYKIGKLKTAKHILLKGIDSFPNHLELYLSLSSILKDTERTNESIEILKKALQQENLTRAKGGIERKDIWAELATLYFERASFNSCIVSLKRSLHLSSEETFLHYPMLSKSYLILNDPMSALKYIDKQLLYFEDLDPEDFITKARAHARLGELHLATANLLQAYDSDGYLKINSEEMTDFSELMKNGFFSSIENFEIIN
jgi:tetratricopeptide (TPR) repeat protein